MLDSLLRILTLVRKELLAILKDPRSRFSLLVPPVLQCLIFGYAATYDLTDVPYAVLDQDSSQASTELLAGLDGTGVFHRVAEARGTAELARCVDERRALVALRIDRGFESRLEAGLPAALQVISDGRNSNTAATASSYLSSIVEAYGTDWRAAHGAAGPAVRITMRAWYNPDLETRWNMVPALIGTLTMLQTLLLTAMSVAREREQGTFDQLLVTPFRAFEIMIGKALPSIAIGLVQATNVLLVAQLWFEIPFAGSFATLYAGLFVFLLAAVGIGLLVSSIARTMQQAMLYSFMLNMPFSLLSGLATPIGNMPRSLQIATLANPLRYAIDMARRVYLEGAGLDRLVPDLLPLAATALVTLSASSWMFRNRLA